MTRHFVGLAVTIALLFSLPSAYALQRGGKGGEKERGGESKGKGTEPHNKGGEGKPAEGKGAEGKSGGKAPGGEWSEGPGKKSPGNQSHNQELEGKNKPNQATGAEGAAAGAAAANKNKPGASGAEGAAAGAAAANRNKPAASGAEGAAAGAAAANRNKPAASGAEGAAVGAAAANRNNPAASGAEGAALGAAAANRNNQSVSGAAGAALGAAAANRNNPSVTGAQGAALGAAAANSHQPGASGAVGAAAGYSAVRDSFDHPSLYNQQWHTDHPEAWVATNWPAGAAWTATNAASAAAYFGAGNNAVSYDYGNNVVNQNGSVLIDGQTVGTSEEFSQQAAELAQIGQNAKPSADDHWLPLGVFALVRNEDQHAQLTVQLAINKQGILQGNYTDLVSDHTLPIHGSVDTETQRAAWTIGNNKNFFMEAGLSNLTSGETPALIHKFNRTEKWLLIRLPKPESENVATSDSKGPQ